MNTKQIITYLGLALLGALALGLWTSVAAPAAAPLLLTEEQFQEFQNILGEMKGGWTELRGLPAGFRSLQDETTRLQQHVTDVRRLMASRGTPRSPTRPPRLA